MEVARLQRVSSRCSRRGMCCDYPTIIVHIYWPAAMTDTMNLDLFMTEQLQQVKLGS